MSAPLVIAHRTCPLQAPENSLLGIGAASEQGADAVEIDLRMSLDQRPFLFHDWTMRRTTGWPLPIELTPSYQVRMQKLQNTEQRVPTLDEALDALGPEMRVAVDVKTPWAILSLMRQIKRRRMEDRALVWCTSALAVRYAVRTNAEVEVAYLKDDTEPRQKRAFIEKARSLGAKAVSAHWRAIDSDFVAEAHRRGLKVYSFDHGWGDELTPSKLSSGLDGLITDHVVEAKALLKELGLTQA